MKLHKRLVIPPELPRRSKQEQSDLLYVQGCLGLPVLSHIDLTQTWASTDSSTLKAKILSPGSPAFERQQFQERASGYRNVSLLAIGSGRLTLWNKSAFRPKSPRSKERGGQGPALAGLPGRRLTRPAASGERAPGGKQLL